MNSIINEIYIHKVLIIKALWTAKSTRYDLLNPCPINNSFADFSLIFFFWIFFKKILSHSISAICCMLKRYAPYIVSTLTSKLSNSFYYICRFVLYLSFTLKYTSITTLFNFSTQQLYQQLPFFSILFSRRLKPYFITL